MKNTNLSRLHVVDALRGFAVFAILLVHTQEHFMFFQFPDAATQPNWLVFLDKLCHNVIFELFAGKSYAIFALLFGLTFYIQQESQKRKGGDFGYRFLLRIFWLAGFASLNALIFPGGDVLMLYAFVGLILFVVRNWSTKAILFLATLLLLQPLEWINYALGNSIENQVNGPLWGEIYNYTANGTFGEFLLGNLTTGQKASFVWAIETGRFAQTGGLFLLGFLFGRTTRFTESERNLLFWRNILITSAICYVPLHTIAVATKGGYPGYAFDMWQKLALMFVLVPAFVLSYWSKKRFRNWCAPLHTYGRMSLSNYLGQSVLGALLFFPFFLNLAPVAGMTVSLFIGIGMFIVQVCFCKFWFNYFSKGPLEYLWGKLTWLGGNK
ncbi:MAG: DUF418 domain-containing protein [Phocaeicola sp.]